MFNELTMFCLSLQKPKHQLIMKKIYLLLISFVVVTFTITNTKAQLPEIVGLPHTFNSSSTSGLIDLDNNRTPDFWVDFYDNGSGNYACIIMGGPPIDSPSPGLTTPGRNRIITEFEDSELSSENFFSKILSTGDPISSASVIWSEESYFFRNNPLTSPAPLSGTFYDGDYDGYIGVYFLGDDNEFHYGWISVTMDASGSFVTLGSSAYNPSPGQPFTAGASATPVPVPLIASILGFGLIGGGILLKRRKRNK